MAEHNTLTDPELHEPKGASTAAANAVYIADGLGSGSWSLINQFADIYTQASDSLSVGSIGTTPQTLPFPNDGEAQGISADSASNRITVSETGVYLVSFTMSFSTVAAGDAGLYTFTIQDDGVDTVVSGAKDMSGSGDTTSVSCIGIISAASGSHITVAIESDEAGNTDDINITNAQLAVVKVG